MPTPFTHLETAQRLLVDDLIPAEIRAAFAEQLPAFLLGNIAADARISGDITRETTHFYSYDRGITEHPWRVMVQRNPELNQPATLAQQVFVAGYVAHLSIDEGWSLHMLGPHFAQRTWGTNHFRFLMLHMLLIYMDERDYHVLLPWQQPNLATAVPDQWLPFMNDRILSDWRDFISQQLAPVGTSQTLEVLGKRINMQASELRDYLDSTDRMEADLWANISRDQLQAVEETMYRQAREQMLIYWNESRIAAAR